MTVQPKLVPQCDQSDKKKSDKKQESIYSNVNRNNSVRVKQLQDKPVAGKQAPDLFNTGRDSWLNMPKDLGPKLNRSRTTAPGRSSQRGRKETSTATVVESEVSVLEEELNRAADEILKAVNGYTDDESVHPHDGDGPRPKSDSSSSEAAKLKNKKKAARLLQRANSREALLHLDGASSSDEDGADEPVHCRPKPKIQRKAKPTATAAATTVVTATATTNTVANSVANKTTASFTKK